MAAKFVLFCEVLLIIVVTYTRIVQIECLRNVRIPYWKVTISYYFGDYTKRVNQIEHLLLKWEHELGYRESVVSNGKCSDELLLNGQAKFMAFAEADSEDQDKACFKFPYKTVFKVPKDNKYDNLVMIVITYCAFDNLEEMRQAVTEWQNLSGHLFFVCVHEKEGDEYRLRNEDAYKKIKDELPRNNKTFFFDYKTDDDLVEELKNSLPKDDIQVQDCVYKTLTTGCIFNNEKEKCEKFNEVIVEMQPYVIPNKTIYVNEIEKETTFLCPENKTQSCDEAECKCEKHPWEKRNCSVTCGNGTMQKWRNVSQNPENCNETEIEVCLMEPCTTTTTTTTTISTTVVVGGVVGGIMLIVLIAVMLYFVKNRHRFTWTLPRCKRSN